MLLMIRISFLSLLLAAVSVAQTYTPSRESPPALTREFRGAWIAVVHNIDWPSKSGMSASAQQAEMRSRLDKLAALRINAVIFQVRPQSDAVYASSKEPWSQWLTGTMGKNPGYDPLTYCIQQAHARGIEVHAWFNPFRALCNTSYSASSNHITRAAPQLTKRYSSLVWSDPSLGEARSRAMAAILDVVRRYDIDGVHLDDYFYPYPTGNMKFPDGKTPAQRRSSIDRFVENLYSSVKKQKPWVRVGISPFGIWRPGVPSGIEAGIDSYEQLACDSRKWLAKGWVDYLAPQLYWRISPQKQSFPVLLEWWRSQGSRPVWPGIATARIQSSDDPGRPASEITNQIALSRKIGKNWQGHIHWSAKSLVTNQGGIADRLSSSYTQCAAVPPMPWMSKKSPNAPGLGASVQGSETHLEWQADPSTARVAIQARNGNSWKTLRIAPAGIARTTIPKADAVALTALDRFGNTSPPKVLSLR
jgi:uncharacterized lipoprotein YddW (UPF0748 family)